MLLSEFQYKHTAEEVYRILRQSTWERSSKSIQLYVQELLTFASNYAIPETEALIIRIDNLSRINTSVWSYFSSVLTAADLKKLINLHRRHRLFSEEQFTDFFDGQPEYDHQYGNKKCEFNFSTMPATN